MPGKPTKLPDSSYLHECFSYSKEDGVLRWKNRPISHFLNSKRRPEWEMRRRNSLMSGRLFGTDCPLGYKVGSLDGKGTRAHRIIWKMFHGTEPEIIDHINGDARDNRIENLMSGSQSNNLRNTKLSKSNTSGRKGVYFHKQSGGWTALAAGENGKVLSKFSMNRDVVEKWRSEMEDKLGYTKRGISI